MTSEAPDVSRRLQQWRTGDREAADQLLTATCAELRRIARGFLRNERTDHTLQPTALVREAFLRLVADRPVDLESRWPYFSLIAGQMRRHLTDPVCRRRAVKRGGGADRPAEDVRELSFEKIATALGVSAGTVKRDFEFARAWLAREIGEGPVRTE